MGTGMGMGAAKRTVLVSDLVAMFAVAPPRQGEARERFMISLQSSPISPPSQEGIEGRNIRPETHAFEARKVGVSPSHSRLRFSRRVA